MVYLHSIGARRAVNLSQAIRNFRVGAPSHHEGTSTHDRWWMAAQPATSAEIMNFHIIAHKSYLLVGRSKICLFLAIYSTFFSLLSTPSLPMLSTLAPSLSGRQTK